MCQERYSAVSRVLGPDVRWSGRCWMVALLLLHVLQSPQSAADISDSGDCMVAQSQPCACTACARCADGLSMFCCVCWSGHDACCITAGRCLTCSPQRCSFTPLAWFRLALNNAQAWTAYVTSEYKIKSGAGECTLHTMYIVRAHRHTAPPQPAQPATMAWTRLCLSNEAAPPRTAPQQHPGLATSCNAVCEGACGCAFASTRRAGGFDCGGPTHADRQHHIISSGTPCLQPACLSKAASQVQAHYQQHSLGACLARTNTQT